MARPPDGDVLRQCGRIAGQFHPVLIERRRHQGTGRRDVHEVPGCRVTAVDAQRQHPVGAGAEVHHADLVLGHAASRDLEDRPLPVGQDVRVVVGRFRPRVVEGCDAIDAPAALRHAEQPGGRIRVDVPIPPPGAAIPVHAGVRHGHGRLTAERDRLEPHRRDGVEAHPPPVG